MIFLIISSKKEILFSCLAIFSSVLFCSLASCFWFFFNCSIFFLNSKYFSLLFGAMVGFFGIVTVGVVEIVFGAAGVQEGQGVKLTMVLNKQDKACFHYQRCLGFLPKQRGVHQISKKLFLIRHSNYILNKQRIISNKHSSQIRKFVIGVNEDSLF